MDTATLTWALLAAAIAIGVLAGLWWRGQQQHRAEAARKAAAVAEAEQQARKTAQQAAQQEAQRAAQAAAERQRAEQTIRAQAEREAEQHARAEAERAAAAEQAARRAAEQAAAEARAREEAERAEAAREAAAQAAARAAALAPRRPADTLVMVADDSKVVRVKTSRLLAQHGYRVVLAEDGEQAAQLIETEVPTVLVTDVEMPGLDGFALTRHVRAHPLAGRIPIIMITSADHRLKEAAAEAGVTLVLGKPYPEDELIACIERSQATATA
jgi:CheY-like chemotaxis protein